MPSPNTNILKKYINEYKEITEYYNTYAIKDMEEYIVECDDILALNDYNFNINDAIENIDKFCSELGLVLNTIRLINDEKYDSMLSDVKEIRFQYSCHISIMEPYINQWNNGY